MRVVHLEAGTHLYGGALQVLLLLEGLRDRGVEGLLVTPPGSAMEGEARKRGLPVHPLPLAGEADPLFPLRFQRLLRVEEPDLVHLHSRRGADTLGGLAASWTGVPAVLSRRVDNPEPAWLVGPKYRLYRAVITISRAILEVLADQGVPREKLRCVRSALDPEPLQGPCPREAFLREFSLPPGLPVVGMAAQFIPRKGHELLLDALPRVLDHHPDTRVILFGRGPLLEGIREEVRRRGLQDHVLLPGFRDDLPRFLPCLDLLVHPPIREGLGVILLQASAAGVPVVATAVGGVPEAVADGETGLLVPPGDPRALATALSRLLAEPRLRKRMGDAGQRRVDQEFSVDAMVDGNLATYQDVLARTQYS